MKKIFLKKPAQIYRSEKVLTGLEDTEFKNRMKLADSEAVYHGFSYGVLAINFKYKYAPYLLIALLAKDMQI